MRTIILNFFRRGLTASGFGPIVLAVLYLILHSQGSLETLTANQVCVGIFSLWALAFIAGGMNVIYQIERLPLMVAIFIHGSVLYVSYLLTYLLNSWLEWGTAPILIFSAIFILGYLTIWMIIYVIIRKRTQNINKLLEKKQQCQN